MKTFLVCIICAVIFMFLFYVKNGSVSVMEMKHTTETQKIGTPQICVQLVTDVSASIKANGVDLPTSEVFTPYFNTTDVSLELSFSCITERSTTPPLLLSLPAFTDTAPPYPDLSRRNIVERRKAVQSYKTARDTYVTDSIRYFSNRHAAITSFRLAFDSIVNHYRGHLTKSSDVYNAVLVANDAFESAPRNAHCILILNSDGQDSRRRNIDHLSSNCTVFLVNAAGTHHSNLEPVVTKHFVNLPTAINYSLQTPNQ